ncbi:MAG: hypothetical protein OEZ35_01095 [Candidatus Bathyarchaeota archaeon]|nr:hypothetical protein [Candidatus Bathyarchaeota archaeon]
MYFKKKQIIEIPKLKQSKTQGKIGYHFLEIIDRKPFRKISEVRKEFKPVVIKDKEKRAKGSPRLWKSFLKQTATPNGTEKLFDSEYCRLRDFLDAFDFVATLGSRADEEITLTYFGSRLLNLCREKNAKGIFDESTREFMSRVYLFIDNYKRWNFIQIIQKKGPISLARFLKLLLQHGIGFDAEKIKRDIAAKPSFKRMLSEEWRRRHRLAPIDRDWKERMTSEYADVEMRKNAYVTALLNLYVDAGLLRSRNGTLSANMPYINRLHKSKFWKTSEEVGPEAFFTKAYTVYRELVRNKGVISLPIPELRKATCISLDLPWYSFDRLLQMHPMGYGQYEAALTRASSKRRLDLSINSKHFYYVQLKKSQG